MFHFTNDVLAPFEVLPVPSPPGDGNAFINVLIGPSDRPAWAAGSNGYAPNGGIRMYFDIGTVAATYEVLAGGGSTANFAVRGEETWLVFTSNIGAPGRHLLT